MQAPVYDYVLAVGPGRSGTTLIYRALAAHPSFAAGPIKEAHYYRSQRRLRRARRAARRAGATVLDVADKAWRDRRLDAVRSLTDGGWRVLLVVTMRRHRDWARSTVGYRRSRVLPAIAAGLAGDGGLERAVERDSLGADALRRIFALGADVLTVDFDALVADPRAVLDTLARLCGAPPLAHLDAAPVNAAQAARFPPFAAAAKLAAVTLRALGARGLLQALKDRPRIVGLFFRPAPPDERPVDRGGGGGAARPAPRRLPGRGRGGLQAPRRSGSGSPRPAARLSGRGADPRAGRSSRFAGNLTAAGNRRA